MGNSRRERQRNNGRVLPQGRQGNLSEEGTCEQRTQGYRGASHGKKGGRSIPDRLGQGFLWDPSVPALKPG